MHSIKCGDGVGEYFDCVAGVLPFIFCLIRQRGIPQTITSRIGVIHRQIDERFHYSKVTKPQKEYLNKHSMKTVNWELSIIGFLLNK
ncbi:hypothetical protein D3C78_1376410 [compost metagenome]